MTIYKDLNAANQRAMLKLFIRQNREYSSFDINMYGTGFESPDPQEALEKFTNEFLKELDSYE